MKALRRFFAGTACASVFLSTGLTTGGLAQDKLGASSRLYEYKHIVVIYQENHSFDNLYGLWGKVGHDRVNGLDRADAAHTLQRRQDGLLFECLLQDDVNLSSPPLADFCEDSTGTLFSSAFKSAFRNRSFNIEKHIPANALTCPTPDQSPTNGVEAGKGAPGGCTRDLVHRFYNEQYQIDGGRQDRYAQGSDAAGLAMGYYDTKRLPIYKYLHAEKAVNYVITDSFFQAAFGGSFLNHQWLIAARTPVFKNAERNGGPNDLHSILDANGMPTKTPLYQPVPAKVADSRLTALCSDAPHSLACGDYAVNTIQPTHQPFSPGTPDPQKLPPLDTPTIGDRLSEKGIDWAWYSGGWSNANGDIDKPGWTNGSGPNCGDSNANPKAVYPNCPDKLFQFHHQAFNYFGKYAPGTKARRDHLLDEEQFLTAAKEGRLKPVSFVKPLGRENEHPGYASETTGSDHLVDLVKAVVDGKNGHDTLVIITYDEFGGAWDHVPPPGAGRPGVHDEWGPGTRIPALLISKRFPHSGVDHVDHDTTSILKLIEQRWGLQPLSSRDASISSLSTAISAAHE